MVNTIIRKNIRTKRAAEIQDAIRRVLYDDWDPIGVSGWGPKDEYDSYIAQIYRILTSNGAENDLIEYLMDSEIGIYGHAEKCDATRAIRDRLRPIAQKLLAVDASF